MRHWTADVRTCWGRISPTWFHLEASLRITRECWTCNFCVGAAGSNAVVVLLSLVSLTAIYIDLGIHTDVEVHSDICLTGSLTAVLGTLPHAEPSGTRLDGSVHDGDPSVEKMLTLQKVTNVSVQFVSPGGLVRGKFYVSSTVDAARRGRVLVVISLIPSACLGISKLALDHDMGWAWKNAVTETGQIADRVQLGGCQRGSPQCVARSHGSERWSSLGNSTWPRSNVRTLLLAPTRWLRS